MCIQMCRVNVGCPSRAQGGAVFIADPKGMGFVMGGCPQSFQGMNGHPVCRHHLKQILVIWAGAATEQFSVHFRCHSPGPDV